MEAFLYISALIRFFIYDGLSRILKISAGDIIMFIRYVSERENCTFEGHVYHLSSEDYCEIDLRFSV